MFFLRREEADAFALKDWDIVNIESISRRIKLNSYNSKNNNTDRVDLGVKKGIWMDVPVRRKAGSGSGLPRGDIPCRAIATPLALT